MSVSYLTGCVDVPAYITDCCIDEEPGRIRAAAFVRKDFVFANDDITDATEWQRGVTLGQIILVPDVRGSLAAPSFTEEDGYGDTEGQISSLTYEITYRDRNYSNNCDTYSALMRNGNYRFAYVTKNFVHLSDKPAVVMPKPVVPENYKETAYTEVTARFTQQNLVCPVARPADVFDCDFQ